MARAHAATAPERHGWRGLAQRPWWPWVGRGLAAAFFAVVAALIFHQARTVDWPAVLQALRALPVGVLAGAGALALLSHLTYGTFDWVGRHCTGHGLPRSTTLGMAMTSYAFTLNLGSLIGGVGVRYRLYARRGVDPGTIGQVVGTSILTNWVGYLLLMAALPWLWQPPPLAGWTAAPWQLRAGGAVLGCVAVAYVLLCALRAGRALTLRGHAFPLPRWPVALWQVAVSALNWMLMGAALYTVLQGAVPYPAALAAVMLGAVAGLVLRVPAGLGVLEAVGVALLTTPTLGQDQVLAALLAYRALYYFVPLVLAGLAFGVAELRWRRADEAAAPATSSI
ncbi:MAG: lysylphosphatidylglycerol synthase domain-containing protein [Acidovorax sp.]|uniref:lysylphosphatidylglycerol synthase domain-containing protein n=1 Tax=Acidovorax sp. TaxID=1872122 RepID=UPI0025C48720|nr:lysylphosphatidylglycerol synthase domain-containing protein [Acidovorax sp.]MCE1191177.1 lysylphosphatidylglycerol synthase domain-containing protein [Acidovorax sp.]